MSGKDVRSDNTTRANCPDRQRDIWDVALTLAYRHEWDVEHVYTGLIACEKAGAKWSYFIGRYLIGDGRAANDEVEAVLAVLLEALYAKKEVFDHKVIE